MLLVHGPIHASLQILVSILLKVGVNGMLWYQMIGPFSSNIAEIAESVKHSEGITERTANEELL
jgi:hypothetical protein